MVLKCGSIIPFQYNDIKKLLVLAGANNTGQLNICDVKNAVHSAFTISNCEFYNKKIGFQIPEELLIPYLEQRHDLTNFIIEVIGKEKIQVDEQKAEYKPPKAIVAKANTKAKAASSSLISKESKREIGCSGEDVPMTKKSKQVANTTDVYLKGILQTSDGQAIWVNFKSCNRLNEKDRLLLVELIASYELKNILKTNNPLSIDNQRYLDLAAAIAHTFPGEDSAEYYVPSSKNFKNTASGRLYEHFNTLKCDYLEMEASNRYCNSSQELVEADFPELVDLQEIIDDWSSYYRGWQHSFEIRMIYMRNIVTPWTYFEKFIHRVNENATELVEYDFERLHPGKRNQLLDNWNHMSERIFTEAIVSCRNDVPLILDLYGNLPQLSGFMMLSYFLKNYESNVHRFGKDNPSNLIVHIEITDRRPLTVFKEYCQKRNQLDPMVFVTGKNADDFSFYVLVGESLYCMETALRAVDFCFKCYQVLHLSYPKRLSQVWQVIQKALYEIHKDEDDLSCENFLNIFNSS